MTRLMLEVTGAVKAFGTVTALSGVDLAVPPGQIAALLGPNGPARPRWSASWPRWSARMRA